MELLQNSLFTLQIETYSIFLDKEHSQDIDLKLPVDYHTTVTLGPGVTKDKLEIQTKAKNSGLQQSFIALARLIPSICMPLVEIGDLYLCTGSAAFVTQFQLRSLSPLTNRHMTLLSVQLSTIQSLSGKIPVDINILKVGEVSPTGCAVFPVSADANVYLAAKDRIQDARKEVEKFKAKLTAARRHQEDINSITAD